MKRQIQGKSLAAKKLHIQNPAESTTFIIQLDYFNTSSAKCIIDFWSEMDNERSSTNSQPERCFCVT